MITHWFERLHEAINSDGRSLRGISLAAGRGENFVQQLLNTKREPGVDKLDAVLGALGPEAALYVLTGLRITAEDQEFLALLATLDPDQKRKALDFFAAILQGSAAPPAADPPSSPPTSA